MFNSIYKPTGEKISVIDGPWNTYDKSGDRLPSGRWPIIDQDFTVKFEDGREMDVNHSQIGEITSASKFLTKAINQLNLLTKK